MFQLDHMNENEKVTQEVAASRKKSSISRLQLLSLVSTPLIIAAIILTTKPSSGGPVIVLLVLALLFVLLLNIAYHCIKFVGAAFRLKYTVYHSLLIAVCVVVGLILILGLQTLGQLGVVDVLLILFLEILLLFYITRRF